MITVANYPTFRRKETIFCFWISLGKRPTVL